MVEVKWAQVPDIHNYVVKTLSIEADDIPLSKIERYPWQERVLELDRLSLDQEMLASHDLEQLHIQRRDGFVESIQNQREILPLIALGMELYLVDGFARYRALRLLGITEAKVLCQI